jgi:methyltransferase (TIGR00027 family)
VLCRKRYITTGWPNLAAGIQAVVILGAGLDTRAYRLPALSAMPVFEVDLPENIAYKRNILQKLYGGVPGHVALVPLDFDRQDLASALASQGYNLEDRSFFIWEAVTQYLSEDGIHKTMRFLSQAKAGSRLVFTYILKDFIDGKALYGLDALYQTYRVEKPLWHFGLKTDQVAAFLEQYAWKELSRLQPNTLRLPAACRSSHAVMEIERAVLQKSSAQFTTAIFPGSPKSQLASRA